MRNHVINEISLLAEQNSDILLVTADLGFHVIESFRDRHPDRFINVGISEQSMASLAAGLALEGNTVFIYSIGNFPTLRCIEQIRNDICYHNADVKIISVGGGFAYGTLGMTHHATEDIAMMRALPNMRVYAPADRIEAIACLHDSMRFKSPAFIRLAKGNEPCIWGEAQISEVEKLLPYHAAGTDVNIITVGTALQEGIELQRRLAERGYSTGVFSAPTVKPLDKETVCFLAKNSRLLVTIEEHTVNGGLGGTVAEAISMIREKHAVLYRAGLQDTYTSVVGSQSFLREYYGISASAIENEITRHLSF